MMKSGRCFGRFAKVFEVPIVVDKPRRTSCATRRYSQCWAGAFPAPQQPNETPQPAAALVSPAAIGASRYSLAYGILRSGASLPHSSGILISCGTPGDPCFFDVGPRLVGQRLGGPTSWEHFHRTLASREDEHSDRSEVTLPRRLPKD